MVELPLVVVDVQRSGPSTGHADQDRAGRPPPGAVRAQLGLARCAVVAPATPGECFQFSIEAWRLALKYMTPVVYMSDAFLATGAEPWRIPNVDDLPSIAVPNRTEREGFYPYLRDETTLARPWAVPGTPGLEHRIGGLEKADILGNVSYDPDNHHRMQLLRQAKIAGIADDIPPLEVYGPSEGDLLVLGWGSTYGAIRSAVERLQARGASIAHAHLRYLNPFPANTGDVVRGLPARADPRGQPRASCSMLIRARYLVDAIGYNRVRGKPFRIAELEAEAERILATLGATVR